MKLTTYLKNIIFFIVITLFTVLIIFGILYKPNPSPIELNVLAGNFKTKCTSELVTCTEKSDCQKVCQEQENGVQMDCIELATFTDVQKIKYGETKKVCAPSNAKMNCNKEHGGLLSWAGWGGSGIDLMEWDCICSYPAYASTEGCSSINPDICTGGEFNWDITKNINNGDPSHENCKCPEGTTKMVSNIGGRPICVKSDIKNWYSDIHMESTT